MSLVGSQIGHYKILHSVGRGGMGEVFAAEDTRLRRRVAIKFLPSDLVHDPISLERFYREARAASALNHPNICVIHSIDEFEGQPYIVMELLPGEPLSNIIERYNASAERFPLERILRIAAEATQALQCAHEHGITHRDIKPANIFITDRDVVKILDFGLAIDRSAPGGGSDHSTRLTHPGSAVGTISYMSPEQARGEELDPRSDLFSLGCVLYEMCTGVVAFKGATSAVIFDAILNRAPVAPIQVNADLPRLLSHVINRLLEKDKESRYQTAAELAEDLRRVAAGDSGIASAGHFALRQHLRYAGAKQLLILAALLVVLVFAGIGVFKYASPRKSLSSIAVLPFANDTGDAKNDYLTEGITEGIIRDLSRGTAVNITAKSAINRYARKAVDPLAAGRELGVAAVLAGTVRERDGSFDIDVELVDTADGKRLWGEHYRRQLRQVAFLEDDISQDLEIRVLKEKNTNASIKKAHAIVDPEAYRLYALGRSSLNKRTADSLHQAAGYFDRAIEKDPQAALAYAGLAQAYVLLPQYDPEVRPDVTYLKAKEDARRAIELDDSLSDAYTALGYAKAYADWDLGGAAQDFEQALALNPNDITARQWYAELLVQQGRTTEAMAEIRRAIEKDPQSAVVQHVMGFILESQGDYDAAIEQYEKALALDPRLTITRTVLADLYFYRQRYERGLAQLQIIAEQMDSEPMRKVVAGLSATLSAKGSAAMLKEYADFQAKNGGTIAEFLSAQGFAFAQDKNKALERLELSASQHEWAILYIDAFPEFKFLKSEPRFNRIEHMVGLAQ